jgi:hypothetical protein
MGCHAPSRNCAIELTALVPLHHSAPPAITVSSPATASESTLSTERKPAPGCDQVTPSHTATFNAGTPLISLKAPPAQSLPPAQTTELIHALALPIWIQFVPSQEYTAPLHAA